MNKRRAVFELAFRLLLPRKLQWGLDNAAKLGGMALVAIYLIGFVAVTANLARFGVFYLDMFKLQYLFAGFWVISPVVFPAVIVTLIFIVMGGSSPFTGKKYSRASSIMGAYALAAFLIIGPALMAKMVPLTELKWGELILVSAVAFFSYASVPLATGIVFVYVARRIEHLRVTCQATLWCCTVALLALSSSNIYPNIPRLSGGGFPTRLKLVFSSVSAQARLGLPLDSTGVVLDVLLETEGQYVVLTGDSTLRAVTIDKSVLDGVVGAPMLQNWLTEKVYPPLDSALLRPHDTVRQ